MEERAHMAAPVRAVPMASAAPKPASSALSSPGSLSMGEAQRVYGAHAHGGYGAQGRHRAQGGHGRHSGMGDGSKTELLYLPGQSRVTLLVFR